MKRTSKKIVAMKAAINALKPGVYTTAQVAEAVSAAIPGIAGLVDSLSSSCYACLVTMVPGGTVQRITAKANGTRQSWGINLPPAPVQAAGPVQGELAEVTTDSARLVRIETLLERLLSNLGVSTVTE